MPDIGIQTAVQQCAFSSLIIQGYFYKLAMPKTRIDWWITSRDSVLYILYLSMQSYFLYGNDIQSWASYVLLAVYIIHVVLMKYNH